MEIKFVAHQAAKDTASVMGDYTDCKYICEFSQSECWNENFDYVIHGYQETIRMNNLFWNLQ